MKTKQNGFTGLEIILVIIVVAALGFAGWTWWQSQQAEQDLRNTTEKPEKTTQQSEQPSKSIPGDWVEYSNETVGFSFHYPSEWGEPTVEVNDTRFSLHFGGEQYAATTLAIRAVEQKATPQGDGPWISNLQGYNVRDGQYYSNWSDGKSILISDNDNFKELNNKAIMWTAQCPFTRCNQAWMKGAFNVHGSTFSGIGVLRIDPNRDTPTNSDLELFESVLATLETL